MKLRAIARPLVLSIAAAVVAFGANPVGRLISSAPVEVNGIAAPARNYVPVSIGDEITTKGASAVVQFPDGSGVTLQPNSKLRIEGQPAKPSVQVVSGSAMYDLARTSTVRVVNSKGQTVSSIFDRPLPAANPAGLDPLTPAVVYRNNPRQPGTIAPSSAILFGTFVQGSTVPGGVPTDPAVILPNGLTINLTATTNPTTGAVTYTVTSVTTPVTLPNGTTTTLTITSGALIGDTITPPSGGAGSGTSAAGVTITTSSGTPVTNPNTVLQTTVTTGVANSTLPTGTTAPTPSPVSTGQFRASAS